MRISRKKRPEPQGLVFKYNAGIQAPEIRVIGAAGEHIGVFTREKAFQMAAEAGLDLIEINPTAVPPIAKLSDFGQFKYQQEKEMRKQKAHQKTIDIKGIRLSLRIGDHDIDVRRGQSKKFLDNGDKVRVEIILRGREKGHVDLARTIIENFVKSLEDVRVEQGFQRQGGVLSMIVAKK
ncbi:MAG: translation initiation factor IF-3 [Patescibacteria group bacterium]